MSYWRRARSAASKRSTTRFAPPAAAPPSSRSTCAISSRSTNSPRGFWTAGAGSTSWSATPPNSASSRRSAISIRRHGREVMDLNLTANWRLIRAMDPLLRAAPAGRAIFVTSGVARGVHPYWGPYAVSKAGLEMLVKIYAGEITKTAGARQPDRPRHRAHPAARPRLPRRKPGPPAAAGKRHRRLPRSRPARMHPQRRDP